jgi:5-methylcytosine-specific restriction enzyme A
MPLKTLRQRLIPTSAMRLPVLDQKPGATERIRGRAGMEQRERVAKAHNYLCVKCLALGRIVAFAEIDHRVPLEQGGSNDDSNLDPLCTPCHQAKTAAEAAARGVGKFSRIIDPGHLMSPHAQIIFSSGAESAAYGRR